MRVYLDHNATAPLRPECLGVLGEWGNGSAVHERGRRTRALVESARSAVASCLGVAQRNIIFTSGATEANNMVLKGYPGPVIMSLLEHPSLLKARPDAHLVPLCEDGTINLNALEEALSNHVRPLVSLMAAHNETGVIQPVAEAARLTHQYGGFFHTDAVQAYGRTPLAYDAFDYVTLSGHKIGALAGVGVLYAQSEAPLVALHNGGGQEYGLRAGTENLAGIRTMAVAMEAAQHDQWGPVQQWRDALETMLLSEPGTVGIVPHHAARLANTLLVAYPGVPSATLVMKLDLEGFEVSAGSACHSGKVRVAGTLEAMGIPADIRQSVVRVSIPYNANQADVMRFAGAWGRIKAS